MTVFFFDAAFSSFFRGTVTVLQLLAAAPHRSLNFVRMAGESAASMADVLFLFVCTRIVLPPVRQTKHEKSGVICRRRQTGV